MHTQFFHETTFEYKFEVFVLQIVFQYQDIVIDIWFLGFFLYLRVIFFSLS